jgi:hypothetical protein
MIMLTDWAIGDDLAKGASIKDVACRIHEQTSRHEAVQLIKQLLIEKTEYSADLHGDDDMVMRQLKNTIDYIGLDVQEAIIKYLKNDQ